MSNWLVMATVGLAGIGLLALVYRGTSDGASRDDGHVGPRLDPDFAPERGTARLAPGREESRVSEIAGLHRHQANQGGDPVLAVPHGPQRWPR
jgi:hypothetical protein